ncbi:general transcription factor II-I repeat domain-containing protein 2B [Trichonephila clavipes]|nr:general transcription factor II-I repeat domain-containing protein 2B [Trichonephila clavipes]
MFAQFLLLGPIPTQERVSLPYPKRRTEDFSLRTEVDNLFGARATLNNKPTDGRPERFNQQTSEFQNRDFTTVGKLSSVVALKGRTRGTDLYLSLTQTLDKGELDFSNISAITTDGARSMSRVKLRVTTFLKYDVKQSENHTVMTFPCIVFQENLLKMSSHIEQEMTVVKVVNFIRSKGLNHRFKKTNSVENKERSGRSRIFNELEERWIVRQVHINPRTSALKMTLQYKSRIGKSVRNVLRKLKYRGRVPQRKSYISKANRQARLAFAKMYRQHVCEIQLLQWFLYLSETPCKLHAEDAELGTVRVSQQPVEMPDILPDVDAELGTALVSMQLCELHHAPPVQAFAVRLAETFR